MYNLNMLNYFVYFNVRVVRYISSGVSFNMKNFYKNLKKNLI